MKKLIAVTAIALLAAAFAYSGGPMAMDPQPQVDTVTKMVAGEVYPGKDVAGSRWSVIMSSPGVSLNAGSGPVMVASGGTDVSKPHN